MRESTSNASRCRGWGGSRERAPGGGGGERARVPAVSRPCFCRLLRPDGGLRARTKGNWQGGAFFHRPVPKYVKSPPPFPLSLWTLLPWLPSVRLSVSVPPFRLGVCQPPTGFLPLGSGRPLHPGLSGCLRPSQLFSGLFFCLCPPTPSLLFSLSLDSPFFSLCGPPLHILSVSLRNTQVDHPYLSLTLSYSPLLHRFFLLQALSSFLFVCRSLRMLSLLASTAVLCFG